MDISSMLTDGAPVPQKRTSAQASTPDGARFMGQQQVQTPSANGIPIGGAYPPSRPDSHTPLFAPHSSITPKSTSLTPLQTPSQLHGGNQYPFPTQPTRHSEPYSATTPGGTRTMQQYPHMSPSVYGPGGPVPTLHAAHSTSSHSPTPSSHPSQTPHSIRQSPLATFAHPPGQAPPPQSFHASQPSTPLGPPPPIHRTSNPVDRTSPFHQRTLSGASSSMVTGSPAQHHPSIGNLVESPNAHHRPSSQGGRNSDHHSNPDRERSVSVSPKTMVPPRLSSLGSQHSSQPEIYSARSSLQPSGSIALPGYTPTPTPPMRTSNSPRDVSHVHPQVGPAFGSSPLIIHHNNSNNTPPHPDNRTPIEYHAHKLGMNHLLAPDIKTEVVEESKKPIADHAARLRRSDFAGSVSRSPDIKTEIMKEETIKEEVIRSPVNLKRSAEDATPSEPPAKRSRIQKYDERPLWAQLHPQRLRQGGQGGQPRGQPHTNQAVPSTEQQSAGSRGQTANGQHQQQQQQQQQKTQPPPPQQQQQQHNTPSMPPQSNGNVAALPPWRQDPPLDADLIHMRRILGPWEKSMKWHTPLPSMVATVQDWLFAELEKCQDVGNDPLEGAIEIEAKIGTLINQSDGQRCNLPVCSTTVIHPQANRNYRFESQMNMLEHRKMNEYLNNLTRATTEKGRVPIHYQHLRENDSFRTLSQAGFNELPPTARKRPVGRELKLRTTTDDETGNIKARIVKLPLADLHIFSPQDPYDCRISMNLEVNMNRPDIDPDALTFEPTPERPAAPDRHKDRVSYRHLAFAADLTRVDVKGVAPKFELELELDAKLLRGQMQLVKTGAPNAFGNVIEGFLDNCAILMRHRAQ